MTPPARVSKLDPYGNEILSLHRQGRKLAEISKHLAQTYGLSVALSTLSDYVNRSSPAPATAPPATPAQEMLLDQVAVYAEIQASIRVLVDEVQEMRNAFPDLAGIERRFDLLTRQIDGLKAPTSPAPVSGTSLTLKPPQPLGLPEGQPMSRAVVPAAIIRRLWVRAFWGTTVLWLIVLAGITYWRGYWRLPIW